MNQSRGFIQSATSGIDDGVKESIRKFQSENVSAPEDMQKRDDGGGKNKGGGCSGDSGSEDGQQKHETPEQPQYKLEIEKNEVPENWWDQLPDFDPRVYDAIAMEKAAACVKYIFDGLPDVHELENSMEARGFRKICPKLTVQVPRTKVIKPKEIIYDTTVDTFIKKDQTY